MSKLIVCLGYNLQKDNSLHPVLVNRLKDAVNLCGKNKNSILLLMGSSSYRRDPEEHLISQASAMKKYLKNNFNEIKDAKILVEETTTSTVEQMCYLKKFIGAEKFPYSDLVIVSSKFFGNRVKLYVEYIFGLNIDITFIESDIPQDLTVEFQKVEENKFKQAQNWLKNHKKGDDQSIFRDQEAYQDKVKKGTIHLSIF